MLNLHQWYENEVRYHTLFNQSNLSLRAWPCNSCSRDAFVIVGFWKYNVIVPSVRVHSGVPGFKEKSLVVIWFHTNDLDVCKVHVMADPHGWIGGHGLQLWSSGQNLPLPFCAPQFGSLMISLFGPSTQNYTACNWFCTLCLTSGGQNRLALWGAEKGCWCLNVVCK